MGAVAGPVLLAQPPNSSSAATLGAGLKPPPLPGTIGVLAKEPPEEPQPKSLPVAGTVDVVVAGMIGSAGAAGALGSGAAAHSLPPHTSAPDRAGGAKEGAAGLGGDCCGAGAGGFERLKTELDGAAAAGGEAFSGGGEAMGWLLEGAAKSKRSAVWEEAGWAGAGLEAAGGDEGDANEPKSPKPPSEGFFW